MIKKCITDAASRVGGVGLVRVTRDRLTRTARARHRRNEEGSLLVEVLVGMLILIIVFTVTTVSLSSMADQRVRIEMRDRALAIISNYEELSRVFRCGYLVDRIDDSFAKATDLGYGDFRQAVSNCDFKDKAEDNSLTDPRNAGDQDFQLKEKVNESNSIEKFDISIRYWWEVPGESTHKLECSAIDDKLDLPLILTRAFRVQWKEGSVPREETLIKREPVPGDDVVFVSGNRVNILVKAPSSGSWYATLAPSINSSDVINGNRYIQRHVDGMLGQPTKCVWFPYITADGKDRWVDDSDTPSSASSVRIPEDKDPQSFEVVS